MAPKIKIVVSKIEPHVYNDRASAVFVT